MELSFRDTEIRNFQPFTQLSWKNYHQKKSSRLNNIIMYKVAFKHVNYKFGRWRLRISDFDQILIS